MAVTLASVSPVIGHTGGATLVTIEGSGFRLPSTQNAIDGVTPPPLPSVLVTFGGIVQAAQVASTGTIYVTTAIADPTLDAQNRSVAVDVVVTNIDDNGNPVAGQSATLASAWRYVRANVTDTRTDLVRIIDAFLAELSRQIVPEVTWPANTDFDPDTSDTLSLIEVPQFPAIVVAAVGVHPNMEYSVRGDQEVAAPTDDDPNRFITVSEPDTVDIVFTLVGASDNTKELVNLLAATRRFFKKNPMLSMARDPLDASKGSVAYELTTSDAPKVKVDVDAKTNNLRTFAMTATIVGFQIEEMPLTDPSGNPPATGESTKEEGSTLDDGVRLTIEALD